MSDNKVKKYQQFSDFNLIEPILRALDEVGYKEPTPIQQQAIPVLLEHKDILGCAQTGTGKTAAFALPLLQNLFVKKLNTDLKPQSRQVLTLILTPTRELALQIFENFNAYGKHLNFKTAVIFGGVGQGPQVDALNRGVDVLIATPGRLLDLIVQRHVVLNRVQSFVLDEADRMLDMGFLQDIKKIIALLPLNRHNLFFSATMPAEAAKLAQTILKNPVHLEITPQSTTAEKVTQWLMYVDRPRKKELLKHLLLNKDFKKVIVFTRTKHGADRVAEQLQKSNIAAAAIHGDKSQGARQRALTEFKNDKLRVLIATDIAARGIDVDGVTHVINYEIPHQAESYVHRIGRTARAGAEGEAVSFCDAEEKSFIRDIEKTIGRKIPLVTDQPFHSKEVELAQTTSVGKAKARLESQMKQQQKRQTRSYGNRRDGSRGAAKSRPKSR